VSVTKAFPTFLKTLLPP